VAFCCAGVQVQFLLPSTDTPWQKAEELGWKDRIAMKVDSRNPYQYAPNGLQLTKVKASLKSSVADAGSGAGIRCLFDPWIRDPE
jgi:hypothetical protein